MPTIHPSITPERYAEIREGQRQWTEAGNSMLRTGMVGHGQCFAVVKSFDLELQTGVSHCACCFKPVPQDRRKALTPG